MRKRLIREPQHGDRCSVAKLRADLLADLLSDRPIHRISGLCQTRFNAELAGDKTQSDVIAREARSAITEGACQIATTDPCIKTERVCNDVDITARKFLTDL